MTVVIKQHHHPRVGNPETVRTPEEAGVKEVDTGGSAEGRSVSSAVGSCLEVFLNQNMK